MGRRAAPAAPTPRPGSTPDHPPPPALFPKPRASPPGRTLPGHLSLTGGGERAECCFSGTFVICSFPRDGSLLNQQLHQLPFRSRAVSGSATTRRKRGVFPGAAHLSRDLKPLPVPLALPAPICLQGDNVGAGKAGVWAPAAHNERA